MEQGWRIELLGELRVRRGDQVVARFPKQLAALLLAYLACHPQHPHPRDVLLEALCPELALEDARNSLRVALHLLRRLLEPPDAPAVEPLLVADRHSIRLNPAAFTTDLVEFEAALRAAVRAASPDEQLSPLARAVELYRGELLAGFTEEWVFSERRHRSEQYLDALHRLVSGFEQQGDLERALEYGRRAVRADPLREEAHYDLMRLYAAAGQPSATLAQYQELERLLREELNEKPSAAARALAEELRRNARTLVVARSAPIAEPPASPPPASRVPGPGALDPRQRQAAAPAPAPAPAASPAPPMVANGTLAPVPTSVPAPRLPAQFTRFFGREEEIARVTQLLAPGDETSASPPSSRLVTLTGPGGSGKTRLAIAVAGRLQEAFGGAVAFVPLAEVTEPARIADAVVDALGLPRQAGTEPLEQAVAALCSQPWLLVLDNFEQLVEEGALSVRSLLEHAAGLTCLVTSRQRLNLAGEQEFAVLPLPTPRLRGRGSGVRGQQTDPLTHDPWPLTPLMQFPSVQLFVDRARAVRQDFQVTEANAAAVAALCDRLEGLPLALELAAARIAMLTPAQMLQHLEQRFELLVSRQRDLPARHRTLRAAVEGSYQLLAPELRRLLARLSVFRGGWSLEAAEAVCKQPRVLSSLEQLREASLILAEEEREGVRYGLLEALREYAWERLAESGELNVVRDRHRDWYLQLAEQFAATTGRPEHAAWLIRLEAERDNLWAALAWCQETVDSGQCVVDSPANPEASPSLPELTTDHWPLTTAAEAGLRLALALMRFWVHRGYLADGLQWLDEALARSGHLSPALRAAAFLSAAHLASSRGGRDQSRAFLRSARTEQEKVLKLARASGTPAEIAEAVLVLAEIAQQMNDLDVAWELGQEARERMQALGDRSGLLRALAVVIGVAQFRGDREVARSLLEERLAICRELGGSESLIHTLGALGHLTRDEGDYAQARSFYAESLVLRREAGHQFALAQALEDFAVLAGRERQWERATCLLGAGEAFCETLGAPPPVAIATEYERTVAEGRAALGEAGFAAAWAAGRAMSLDQALEYILSSSSE